MTTKNKANHLLNLTRINALEKTNFIQGVQFDGNNDSYKEIMKLADFDSSSLSQDFRELFLMSNRRDNVFTGESFASVNWGDYVIRENGKISIFTADEFRRGFKEL